MKIVVLMSTYNGEKYVREQIESILIQRGDFQLDLWVRDDGSTDGTKAILQEYALEKKLKWYSSKNMGPANSFLDLIKHCDGYDFYAFADQDDYWCQDKLITGISTLQLSKNAAMYCSNALLVDDNLEFLGRTVYKEDPRFDFYTLSCAGGILGCTMIFNERLATLIRSSNMPQKIIMHDFYVAQVCAAVAGSLFYDPTPHIMYRQHGNNVVGVSYGFWSKLKQRMNDILSKKSVSIADQSKAVIDNYSNIITKENLIWLEKIAIYKKSLLNRTIIALSRKTKYINKNMGFKIRASIFLGNR